MIVNLNETRRGPWKWPLVAIHFGLPSQHWKWPSTLLAMIYGILVPTFFGALVDFSIWIWGLKGTQNTMGTGDHAFFSPSSQHWKRFSVANNGLWCFGPKTFGSWWIVNMNMRLGGDPIYHGRQRPYILAFLAKHWHWPSTLPMLEYAFWSNNFGGLCGFGHWTWF